ncbi:MAG: serine/threonine-protein kinase [Bradymonadia bacterium]
MHALWRCPECQHAVSVSTPGITPGLKCMSGCAQVVVAPEIKQRHPSDPWLGRLISDRYALIDVRPGVGGPGRCYIGLQLPEGTPVEIRIIARGTTPIDDPFFRLAGRIAALSHHGLQPLLDYGETTDGLSYLVHGQAEGRSLLERLQLLGPLTPAQAIDITLSVLDALRPGHLAGVDHRDLKPSNVVVTPHGDGFKVLLKSFGVMSILEQCTTGAQGGQALLGTPSYLAPERLLDRQAGVRSDIYALGVMLYRMISGRLPFTGRDNTEILARQIQTPPPALNVPLHPALEAAIFKALAKRPEDRFATTQSLRMALEAAVALCDDSNMSMSSMGDEPETGVFAHTDSARMPLDDQPTRMLAEAPEEDTLSLDGSEDGELTSPEAINGHSHPWTDAFDSDLEEEPTLVTELDDVSRWVGLMEAQRLPLDPAPMARTPLARIPLTRMPTAARAPVPSQAPSSNAEAKAPTPTAEESEKPSGSLQRWRLSWFYGGLVLVSALGVLGAKALSQWVPGY